MPSTRRLFAKVGFHDFGVARDRLRVAVGDLAPGDEHRDPLGEFHHRAHHVLDHDDRDAPLLQPEEERQDVVHFGGREPGHRLVRNEELGLRRHGARELELSHVHLRQAGEGLGNLEAAREAQADALVRGMPADVLPFETDAAFLVPERPGDAVDERALAGTVRADQADALARPHREVDALQRREAAEPLGHTADLEQRLGHQRSLLRRQASTQPMMPFGASVTKSTSSTPTIRRFHAEETVTCTSCCTVPSSTAPISGPIQLIMPPISGMAMLLTAYDRLNAELGSMYER